MNLKKLVLIHDEMNYDMFHKWFSNILPLLEQSLVIIVDNASYHSVKLNPVSVKSWKKIKIIEWIKSKSGDCSTDGES